MDDPDKNFLVDKILDKRYNKKARMNEYKVRWLGYTAEFDTWEPQTNILDSRLIDLFENSSLDVKSGFDRGLTAKSIIGATNMNGERQFLIVWNEKDEPPELIYSKVANVQCPQVVIEYYEQHLVFTANGTSHQAKL